MADSVFWGTDEGIGLLNFCRRGAEGAEILALLKVFFLIQLIVKMVVQDFFSLCLRASAAKNQIAFSIE